MGMGMIFSIRHPWSLDSLAYEDAKTRPNRHRPVLTIGALSYTGDIKIYDYHDTMREDQEQSVVVIGRACSLADNICFYLYAHHDYRNITTNPLMPLVDFKADHAALWPVEDIIIGNDVWIGSDACIKGGVTIGDGAVVGMKSVVTKDVPPYAIVAGNPATIRKYRFKEEQIHALLEIQWWDWDLDRIRDNAHLLQDRSVERFIAAHLRVPA